MPIKTFFLYSLLLFSLLFSLLSSLPLLFLLKEMPEVWGTMSSNDLVTGLPFTVSCKVCSRQGAFHWLMDGLYMRVVKSKSRPWYLCGAQQLLLIDLQQWLLIFLFTKIQSNKYILHHYLIHIHTLTYIVTYIHTCILVTEPMFQDDTLLHVMAF